MGIVQIGNLEVQDLRETYPSGDYETRDLSEINFMVVHHSVTPNDMRDEDAIDRIYNYHVNSLGWPGIGYHFLVGHFGHIYLAGGVETIRYHASTANPSSIGVCVLGTFDKEDPSCRQVADTDELLRNISMGLGQELLWKPHKELSSTACPGLMASSLKAFRGEA